MIYFDYKHVTQNNKLEEYAKYKLQSILPGDALSYHCKFDFYRVFTSINKVRDVVEMNINIEGESVIFTGRDCTFKKAMKAVMKQLDSYIHESDNPARKNASA